MLGKRVSFNSLLTHFTGSYGEYCVSNLKSVVPIGDDVSFEVGAS